jgi:hypothetical protein
MDDLIEKFPINVLHLPIYVPCKLREKKIRLPINADPDTEYCRTLARLSLYIVLYLSRLSVQCCTLPRESGRVFHAFKKAWARGIEGDSQSAEFTIPPPKLMVHLGLKWELE